MIFYIFPIFSFTSSPDQVYARRYRICDFVYHTEILIRR